MGTWVSFLTPSVTHSSTANECYYWGNQRVKFVLFPWPGFANDTQITLNAQKICILRGLKDKMQRIKEKWD